MPKVKKEKIILLFIRVLLCGFICPVQMVSLHGLVVAMYLANHLPSPLLCYNANLIGIAEEQLVLQSRDNTPQILLAYYLGKYHLLQYMCIPDLEPKGSSKTVWLLSFQSSVSSLKCYENSYLR